MNKVIKFSFFILFTSLIGLYLFFPSKCFNLPADSDQFEFAFFFPQTDTLSCILHSPFIKSHVIFRFFYFTIWNTAINFMDKGNILYIFQYAMLFFVLLTAFLMKKFVHSFYSLKKNELTQNILIIAPFISAGYLFTGSLTETHIITNFLMLYLFYFTVLFFKNQTSLNTFMLISTMFLLSVFHAIACVVSLMIISAVLIVKAQKIKRKNVFFAILLLATIILAVALQETIFYYKQQLHDEYFISFQWKKNITMAFSNLKDMVVFYNRTTHPFIASMENLIYILLPILPLFLIKKMSFKNRIIFFTSICSFNAIYIILFLYFAYTHPITHYIFLIIPATVSIVVYFDTLCEHLSPKSIRCINIILIALSITIAITNIKNVLIYRNDKKNSLYYSFFAALQEEKIESAIFIALPPPYPPLQAIPLQAEYFFNKNVIYINKNQLINKKFRNNIVKELKLFHRKHPKATLLVYGETKTELQENMDLIAEILTANFKIYTTKEFPKLSYHTIYLLKPVAD